MKSYSLDEAQDLLIGKVGTPKRDQFEFELKLELFGEMIRTAIELRKRLTVLLGLIFLFACDGVKETKDFIAFEQKQNLVDTSFLKSVSLENIDLCTTTVTDLENKGYSLIPSNLYNSDSMIGEYMGYDGKFLVDDKRQILIRTYNDSELLNSVWLLREFRGLFLRKFIDLNTYTVRQMLDDFPTFEWGISGDSDYWSYSNNDTTVFYVRVDRSIRQFPLDEEHYMDSPIVGVKMEMSCWRIYGPKYGKKDTVSIKPMYAPLNDQHTNYYLELRKPGLKTVITEIISTGKKSITQQKRIGEWRSFNPDHTLKSVEYYNYGELVKTEQ